MVATTMMLSSLAGSSSRLTARYASWRQGRGGRRAINPGRGFARRQACRLAPCRLAARVTPARLLVFCLHEAGHLPQLDSCKRCRYRSKLCTPSGAPTFLTARFLSLHSWMAVACAQLVSWPSISM